MDVIYWTGLTLAAAWVVAMAMLIFAAPFVVLFNICN